MSGSWTALARMILRWTSGAACTRRRTTFRHPTGASRAANDSPRQDPLAACACLSSPRRDTSDPLLMPDLALMGDHQAKGQK